MEGTEPRSESEEEQEEEEEDGDETVEEQDQRHEEQHFSQHHHRIRVEEADAEVEDMLRAPSAKQQTQKQPL